MYNYYLDYLNFFLSKKLGGPWPPLPLLPSTLNGPIVDVENLLEE